MILTSGLVKRGRIYYFRVAVPRHLTKRLRRAELSISLRTDNLAKAKRSARQISNWVEVLFEGLPSMPELTFESINERIRVYFQTCLNDGAEKAMLLPSDPMADVAGEVAYLHKRVDELKADLAASRDSPVTLSDAKDLMPQGLTPQELMSSDLYDYAGTLPLDPLFAGMQANGLAQFRMSSTRIVESFDVIEHVCARFTPLPAASGAGQRIFF